MFSANVQSFPVSAPVFPGCPALFPCTNRPSALSTVKNRPSTHFTVKNRPSTHFTVKNRSSGGTGKTVLPKDPHLLFEQSPSSLQTGRWTDICLRNPEAKPQSSCPCSPVLQPEWLPPLMLRRKRYLRGYLRCVQTLFPL